MAMPSPSYTVTLRVSVPAHPRATQHLVEAVADAGGLVTGIDTVESLEKHLIVSVTCDCVNTAHVQEVRGNIEMMVGTVVEEVSDATCAASALAGTSRRISQHSGRPHTIGAVAPAR